MTLTKPQLALFQTVGRDMYLTGLVSSHTGTVSTLASDALRISKRDAMLGRLVDSDLLEIPLEGEVPESAPDDVLVHRAVYRTTAAKAVIHARPPATMALALIEDRLTPANGEGADAFGTVAVAISQRPLSSTEIADLMGQMLKDARIAVLRGRGVFAWGDDLDEALHMVSLLEEMCQVAQIYRSLIREEDNQPFIPERIEQRQSGLSPYRGGRDPNQRPPARNNQRRPGGGGGSPRRDGGPRRPPRGGNQGGGPPGMFRP